MFVFDIKRYAINDGPGIRITIFMKGCPLSCVWCHNPEGISSRKQKLYTKKKCIGCRTCVEACPEQALTLTPEGIVTDGARCTLCGICAEVCPAMAMEISGTEYSAEALMKEIEKEIVFMDRSEGGVTFCGGEPLLHPGPLLDLLRRCGERGIHRAVDTTLFARPEIVRDVMDNCELLLVDLKQMDSAKHAKYCGVPNELILSNLRMVAEARRLGYSESSIWRNIQPGLRAFAIYYGKKGLSFYDPEITNEYVGLQKERLLRKEISDCHYRNTRSAANRLNEFYLTGTVHLKMPKHGTKYLLRKENERLIDCFLDYKNYGPNTRDDVVWVVRRYLFHFETLGYESLEQVSVDDVREFILKTAAEVRTSSLHNILLYLKYFHIFLKETGIPAPDCADLFSYKVYRDMPIQLSLIHISEPTRH